MRGIAIALLIIAYSCVTATGKGEKKVEENLLKGPKDLSQLMDLKLILERANPGNNPTDSTQVSAQPQGPCSCAAGVCTCCSRILLNTWNQKACVKISYDPDEFSFTATVSMNDRVLYTRAISGKNPRPVCVPVPRIPAIRACVRFYNIYFQGRNVHVCVSMEGKFSDTTLFKMGLDCVRLGANGVALVRPEDGGGIGQVEFLPGDSDDGNGSNSEEYDEYDEEDDDDDDDY
ncbi:uncharacterized protein LOC135173116 [Diachasmimorpha longicaudata]|uniref:uncharacterized protein LOC135173116 n=1 Tax=Diachasmimorpha longicaudata TaxID=58733 RepID=UPI0030B8DA00